MQTPEYYDEVDKRDIPTGRKITKQQAHDEKLVHRCVAVFVFDKKGNLYVQPHVKSNGRLDHTVGGHVDDGEDYLTAAKREMAEEIGLEDVELEELATSYYSQERTQVHMFAIYRCTAPDDWVFEPNDEVHELKLMKLEEIVGQMNSNPENFTGGFINTMKKYLEVTRNSLKISVEL